MLGYAAHLSFPPTLGEHVESFITVFRNGGTASNYVSSLRWACTLYHKSLAWDTAGVKMAIRGARKATVRMPRGSQARALLTSRLVFAIVAFVDEAWGLHWMSPFLLVAWAILARVQSEICPSRLVVRRRRTLSVVNYV